MTLRAWLMATRPKTLVAGVVPVAVGCALASTVTTLRPLPAVGCLAGSILIQVGTNFANDAFDALKGADTPDRLGPTRAVAAGLISARAMLIATAVVLSAALGLGLYLATIGGWPILALGCVSLVCAVAYTGGPYPLAYHGLGDVFVFLFFGLFAVMGTAWIQVAPDAAALIAAWWWVAAAVGLQATAIIAVNNLRDIATDAAAGKMTLAVRLDERGGRWWYGLLHVGAFACLGMAHLDGLGGKNGLIVPIVAAGLGGAALTLGVALNRGRALNRYLARSAALQVITGVSLVLAMSI
ncbi:MAG: 1,4-dihydroxy-2-naphthoate octaprenyltransferase [Planctomycetes bacterium]|nr:1,4-dihydroxy-2-naphthoate octaprenyltransferase [Planctomycetota bacterium]